MRKNPTKVSPLDNTCLTRGKSFLPNFTDSPQPTLALLGVETSAHVIPFDNKKLYALIETLRER